MKRGSEGERVRERAAFAIACNIKYLIKLRAHIKIALKMPCKCYFCAAPANPELMHTNCWATETRQLH